MAYTRPNTLKLFKTALLSCSGLAIAACSSSTETVQKTSASGANWCLSGGTIYTATDANPTVKAVAVKDGEITYAGDDTGEWCSENAGPGPRKVNLSGATAYPGFTDAHGHLLGIGLREMTLNLEGTKSVTEMQERVKAEVEKTATGQTVYGRGWIETHWPEKRFPNRQDLDAIAPNNPVILTRADGHAAVVNSAALNAAGITSQTKPPFGGDILKDADGEPTGMLIDRAEDLVSGLVDSVTPERKEAAYIKGAALYASRGWTNIHSMSVDPEDTALIERLASEGKIGIRVYNSINYINGSDMSEILDTPKSDSSRVTTRAIKLYSDGALGSRGAALIEPYDDDPKNEGLVLITRQTIMPILRDALREGIQINTHAIGDRANRLVLSWYEAAMKSVPVNERRVADPRWRIEHSQIIAVEDIPRFVELGIIPSMQPSHAIGDLHFAPARIGKDRLKGGYAWRSLIDSGAKIAGGSDAPVEVGDPRIEFYAAMVRKDQEGYSNDAWYPEEKVTPQEALKMFTAWAAEAAFEEDMVGTIEVGKRADFTVLDRDILTAAPQDILTAKPVMTIVDGTAVFEAK